MDGDLREPAANRSVARCATRLPAGVAPDPQVKADPELSGPAERSRLQVVAADDAAEVGLVEATQAGRLRDVAGRAGEGVHDVGALEGLDGGLLGPREGNVEGPWRFACRPLGA